MIDALLNDTTYASLKKGIEGTALRHKAIAQNIANVSTPGYKRKDVKFEDALKKAIGRSGIKGTRTNSRHIPIQANSPSEVIPEFIVDKQPALRVDGNNVDVDQEMAMLAKNAGKFMAMTEILSRKYTMFRRALQPGT